MKNYFLFLIIFLLSFNTFAQIKDDNISGDIVVVDKQYKPLLADAVKVSPAAEMPKYDTTKIKLKYSLLTTLLDLPYIPVELKPIAMTRQEDATPLQNKYVKAGFGTQFSPYFDAHFSNGRNDKIYYAVNGFHNSSNSSKVDFKNFSDTKVNGDVRLQFKKTTLGIHAGYQLNTVYYYGFNDPYLLSQAALDTSITITNETAYTDSVHNLFTKKDLRRRYNLVTGGLWLQNAIATKAGIDYKFTFDEKYFFTNLQDNENEIEAEFTIGKQFNKMHSFNVGLGFNHISIKDSAFTSSKVIVPFHPYYEYRKDIYYGRVGFVVGIADPVLFYPDLYGEVHLLDGHVVPYLNVGGFTDKNLAMNLTKENPFLERHISRNIGKSINLRGGFKGSFLDRFVYSAEMSYRFYDDLPVYYIAPGIVTQYRVIYQSNAGEFNPHAELGYRKNEKITVSLRGDYYKYSMDYQLPAFGYPDWKVTLHANYNLQNKILVNFDLFTASQVNHQYSTDSLNENGLKTKSWIDANLGITYNYKQNFGAFIMVNNIASSAYARWYNYDTYGLMFKAGLLVKF